MPICLVHIAATLNAKDIFLVNNLFYLQISVEALQPSGPAQCFACQRFGHGSRNCGHPPSCVKCAGNHKVSSCTKTLEQTPTCCNCGRPHTANFRGCPQFLAQKQDLPTPTYHPSAVHPLTAVLIHRRIVHQPMTLNTSIQTSSVLIKLDDHEVLISAVYKPPGSTLTSNDLDLLTQSA